MVTRAFTHRHYIGNGRADHLADVGRRCSPLLFGDISIPPSPPPGED